MKGEPVEGGVGVSEWWPAPMKRFERASRVGQLEDAVAAVHTRDCESDYSEVSHTIV